MEWRKPDDGWEQHRRMLEGLQQVAGGGSRIISRFAADVRALIQNGVQTRRILSEQVYRIPDSWLDEVVRVRMRDLQSDDRGPNDPTPQAPGPDDPPGGGDDRATG